MSAEEDFIPTRQSLLSRLKDLGDQESWRVFFETYWKLIYKRAIRAGLTNAEAEDVVQETVISISKGIHKFEYDPAKGSFKNYLMRLTTWRIAGQFRKRLPVQTVDRQTDTGTSIGSVDKFEDVADPALEALWDREWEENILEAAVQKAKRQVDPKLYQAFDLYVHHQWPASKVATDLKISRAKVYLAKHFVGKILKKEVARLRSHPI
ncbi:MAG TPA: sigma-70 family RNA polymerase sigma factor [Clostridia bacterium]|nr:sigma-70 family RNA polymerase sigma factor [Clostridia bacterium]